MARPEIFAIGVNKMGLTVDNTGDVIVINGLFYTFQSVWGVEFVSGVEENQIDAVCPVHGLVHGVVKTFVGLGENPDSVHAGSARFFHGIVL